MINTQILDQIIFDSREQHLEEHLTELDEMPENYINSLCEKSFDEMSPKEIENAINEIKEYLVSNMSTKEERMSSIELIQYDRNGSMSMSYYLVTDEEVSAEESWDFIEENTYLNLNQLELIGQEDSVANNYDVKTAIVFHETLEGYYQRKVEPNKYNLDTQCNSLKEFTEGDNLGWCAVIDEVTYYKVRNWEDEAHTIYYDKYNLVQIF